MAKNQKNTLAESLIESLVEDVKALEQESSFNFDELTSDPTQAGEYLVNARDYNNTLESELVPDKTRVSPFSVQSEKSKSIKTNLPEGLDDKTLAIQQKPDVTIAVTTNANRPKNKKKQEEVESNYERTVVRQAFNPVNATEAVLHQADNLKIAQQRILELEQEVDKYRAENEEYSSAGEVLKNKVDELNAKLSQKSKQNKEKEEALQSEINILRSSLVFKEKELEKIKNKNDELELRVKHDLKKVRVRERELENRLELAKIEKSALVKSKDETILELKRKIDHLEGEVESYREKCLEFNRKVEFNQEQFKRTVKALRLALSNLETNDEVEEILKKVD